MNIDWQTLIVALVPSVAALITGLVAIRRQRQEAASSNVADAIQLKNEYKQEVDELKAEMEDFKDRVGRLEKANADCQKRNLDLQEKLLACEEARNELTVGVGVLHKQVKRLGEHPHFTPPSGV